MKLWADVEVPVALAALEIGKLLLLAWLIGRQKSSDGRRNARHTHR